MKNDCKAYGQMAKLLLQSLEEIIKKERNFDRTETVDRILEWKAKAEHGVMKNPCMSCAHCLDFVFFVTRIYNYLTENESLKQITQQLQSYKKVMATDVILDNYPIRLNLIDFQRSQYNGDKNTALVYLDFNSFNKYQKDESFRKVIEDSKKTKNIHYIYSPSHLEETQRMKNDEEETKMLNAIRGITFNLFISNFAEEELSLAYEDPQYGYLRVKNIPTVARAVEDLRYIASDDREIFYPEYADEEYTKRVSVQGILENPLVKSVRFKFEEEELVTSAGVVVKYSLLKQAVYEYFKILDLLSYKRDKGERDIRSGVYDIEHVVYAAGSNIFVTADKNLRARTRLVYDVLGIQTLVLCPSEYVSRLQQDAEEQI